MRRAGTHKTRKATLAKFKTSCQFAQRQRERDMSYTGALRLREKKRHRKYTGKPMSTMIKPGHVFCGL